MTSPESHGNQPEFNWPMAGGLRAIDQSVQRLARGAQSASLRIVTRVDSRDLSKRDAGFFLSIDGFRFCIAYGSKSAYMARVEDGLILYGVNDRIINYQDNPGGVKLTEALHQQSDSQAIINGVAKFIEDMEFINATEHLKPRMDFKPYLPLFERLDQFQRILTKMGARFPD